MNCAYCGEPPRWPFGRNCPCDKRTGAEQARALTRRPTARYWARRISAVVVLVGTVYTAGLFAVWAWPVVKAFALMAATVFGAFALFGALVWAVGVLLETEVPR